MAFQGLLDLQRCVAFALICYLSNSFSMAVFFGAILLLCSAGIAARYFGRLRPQRRQLDRLIAELTD